MLIAAAPDGARSKGLGDDPSRAEFVAQADRICEVPYRKALRLLYKGDLLADAGRYLRAGKKVRRAGRYTLRVNRRISSLDPPPADARLIERWLSENRSAFELVVDAGNALKSKHPGRATKLLRRANRTTRRANKKVQGFGFNHCA